MVPPGKSVLLINLDETAIVWQEASHVGNIVLRKRPLGEARAACKGKGGSKELRSYLTHIGLVCNDTEIQPKLPQILLANRSTVQVGKFDAVRDTLGDNMEVWVARSAWVNSDILCLVLRRLATVLAEVAPDKQIILQLDCFRAHFARTVMELAASLNIWLVYIPSKLTPLLQTCDTHVFSRFKNHIRTSVCRCRADAEEGTLSVEAWIKCICLSIRHIMNGNSWAASFSQNGYPFVHGSLGQHIRKHIPDLGTHVSHERPRLDDLKCIFPARSAVAYDVLLPKFSPLRRVRSKTSL